MSEEFLQELDQHDKWTVDPQMGPILEQKAAERFVQLYGREWASYADIPENIKRLKGWVFGKGVPFTLRNARVAFDDLVASNQLQKSDSFEIEQVVEEFEDQCPAWQEYRSRENGTALDAYLTRNNLEVSVENLKLAFNVLARKGVILPVVTGFTRQEGKIRIGVPEMQLRQEEHVRASALSEPGKPVTNELRHAAVMSRQKAQSDNGASASEIRDARMAVGNAHPELDVYSKEFAALVGREVARQRA